VIKKVGISDLLISPPKIYTKYKKEIYNSMKYTIEKSTSTGFNLLLNGQVIGWSATPWGARLLINKHIKQS
jgi:hypothetical protein